MKLMKIVKVLFILIKQWYYKINLRKIEEYLSNLLKVFDKYSSYIIDEKSKPVIYKNYNEIKEIREDTVYIRILSFYDININDYSDKILSIKKLKNIIVDLRNC